MNDQAVINALLRSDFIAFLHRCMKTLHPGGQFLPNWHIEAIAYQLERVQRGEITRLIINMPPRSLKSIISSVAFPAFLLGHDPGRKIFGISYGGELAAKHAADFRSIIESKWYRDAFVNMRVRRVSDSDIFTTARGFRRATSIHATLTGLGGDCFIIDDPLKPVDAQSDVLRNGLNDWFSNTLVSRLDNKATGAIIVVMQRVHLHDLTGYLLENSDGCEVLSLPAIAEADEEIPIRDGWVYERKAGEALHPEREPLRELEKLQKELGTAVFVAQYQQAPIAPGGSMIRREWLRYFDEPTEERAFQGHIIQSWDCAGKTGGHNSWSVCTTWQVIGEHYCLLDVTRGRYEYPQLRDTAMALAERFDPLAVLIEEASTGIALAQELRQAGVLNIKPIPVERDKETRLFVQQAKFEAGRVHFPKGARFLRELEAELLAFPQSKTNDQVDSISQALAYKPSYDSTLSWVEN